MKRMTAGDLQALELLMQTRPGFEHIDSGADGILPECRSCRFHRPFWKYQMCIRDRLRGFTAGSGCGGHSADYGNFKSERL